MKGKPNFLKKQENQIGNNANGLQQQIQSGESKSRTEITLNSNGNSKPATTSSSKQPTRFCPSDPLALLDENDLNFPELYIQIIHLDFFTHTHYLLTQIQNIYSSINFIDSRDYPKKIVNDIVAAGGIRIK